VLLAESDDHNDTVIRRFDQIHERGWDEDSGRKTGDLEKGCGARGECDASTLPLRIGKRGDWRSIESILEESFRGGANAGLNGAIRGESDEGAGSEFP
jgi:hypothetical protein